MARGFGDLEKVVMDRLWTRTGPTSVREVFEELLTDREIAYTTVMSTMDNLHTKGWLTRQRHGKAYLYTPAMTREQYSAQLMREALNAGGSSELVLTHFLDHITDDESAQLRKVLQRLRTRKATP
ncbi:BlaI/MecI/CopY family transcriptional regulator [Mycobacterium sp. OTB74]|uniref:BlaI/MecI/CopY family transcriptional regulator n=1 Tax=Mycobacterium sp. OTB74 TaxID=1853452 RepID=UPI0024752BC9|nr:BlaI/MecI/CopY family transcriptional regulator [Mycobacterium sp. OTB74]MDH6244023.1 putative transcriptional regulator [Mycobacterium sp. OTB74]